MSGLIGFFKDFLPNVQNIDYGRLWEDLTDDETAAGPPRSIDYTDGALTFTEWRQISRQLLESYWDRRLIPKEFDEEDAAGEEDEEEAEEWRDDSEPEGGEEEDAPEGEVEEDRQLESQPPLPADKRRDNDQENLEPSSLRARRIPPLYQAIHSIKTLAYLNLTTKMASVELCKVTKLWRLRKTKRGLHYLNGGGSDDFQQRCPVFPGRMPRTVFGHMQDDGPMGCCYDHVLSLELEQLLPSSNNSLPRRSIRVFLYNAYAKATAEWMEEQSLKGKGGELPSYILSLSRIAARSIMPLALDPRDWWEKQHMLPYCICIGDDSDMILQDEDEDETETSKSMEVIRMDSADMEVRLAKIPNTSVGEKLVVPELVLSPALFRGPAEAVDDDVLPEDNASQLIQSWKKYLMDMTPPQPPAAPIDPVDHEQAAQQEQAAPRETNVADHPIDPPAAPPVIPNFSTTVPAAQPASAAPVAPSAPPAVRAPPNYPNPPSPVHQRAEPMIFEGPPRIQISISDVTNLPPTNTGGGPARYERLSSLKRLYDAARTTTGVRQKPMVNIYGLVVGFTVPSMSKRGDWMCQCNVVDETCTVPITLLIFQREVSRLPLFQRMGDVLRIHRCLVDQWKGEIQLTGRKESSSVVVRRAETKDGKFWSVHPTAVKQYHFETSDEQRAQNLWRWGQKLIQRQPTMFHAKNKFTIGDMAYLTQEDDRNRSLTSDRDLTVMITAMVPYPPALRTSVTAQGFLRIWDGTGHAPSDPLAISITLPGQIDLSQGDPPPTALSKIASIIRFLKEDDSSSADEGVTNMEIPEATCGKVTNAIIWERHHWELIQKHIPIGTFIRLRNVDIRQFNDSTFRCLMVHSRSWLSPLPDITYEIKQLLKEHDHRVKRRNEFNPTSGLLPSSELPQRARAVTTTTVPVADVPPAVVVPAAATEEARPRAILGKGLSGLRRKRKPTTNNQDTESKKRRRSKNIYTGLVRLLPTTVPQFTGDLSVYCKTSANPPIFQCYITITDASKAKIPVLVFGAVAEKLFGISAAQAIASSKETPPCDTPFGTTVPWKVSLQVAWQGSTEFFILKDIEKVNHPRVEQNDNSIDV